MSRRRGLAAKLIALLLVAACLVTAAILGKGFLTAGRTIFDLLNENEQLRRAIGNLTAESVIGYARVLSQEERAGRLVTRLQFVETARNDPTARVLERSYDIEGDIAHFDALIVKFSNEYVMDGRARALYLWRRVYGETQAPSSGFPIEDMGAEPERYADLLEGLPLPDRELFWSEIWKLSNDRDYLKEAGITAIYGNVVYKQLKPGLMIVFKISDTGQIYPETLPDLSYVPAPTPRSTETGTGAVR